VLPVVLARVLIVWLITFVALLLVALPVCLLYRRIRLVRLWSFAITGILAGLILASWSINTPYSQDYAEVYQRWKSGVQIRTAIDGAGFPSCRAS